MTRRTAIAALLLPQDPVFRSGVSLIRVDAAVSDASSRRSGPGDAISADIAGT